MKDGPDITKIAFLLGDPARAHMVMALMSGQALTAGELAREGGVSASTASSHLAKLVEGALVRERRAGRHRYYALADSDVAGLIERLTAVAARAGHNRTRPGPKDPALRRARVCYDHLAGERGVMLFEGLLKQRILARRGDDLHLTGSGEKFLDEFGVEIGARSRTRRPLCRTCLDWSERRSHLAGALGAALFERFHALGWIRRTRNSRVVSFTPSGERAFGRSFLNS